MSIKASILLISMLLTFSATAVSAEGPSIEVPTLPVLHRADGSKLPKPSSRLTRDYCRNKANADEMITCIKTKTYDPCEDASGSSGWWSSQCAWAHLRILKQQQKKLIHSIIVNVDYKKDEDKTIRLLKDSQRQWRQYVDRHCIFTGSFSTATGLDYGGYSLAYSPAYCKKRLNERRVKELRYILRLALEQ